MSVREGHSFRAFKNLYHSFILIYFDNTTEALFIAIIHFKFDNFIKGCILYTF